MIRTMNGNLKKGQSDPTKDNYFDPHLVFEAGPGGCLRGAMAQKTNTVSPKENSYIKILLLN